MALSLAGGARPAPVGAPPRPVHPAELDDVHGRAFQGETCTRCHANPTSPEIPPPEETREVVIVGGGMAGLSALHYLDDRDTLVLELEDQPGGQMREAEWRGIRYAIGAAYFVAPYGILDEFYRREGIELIKIAEPENSAWIRGRFYPSCWTSHGRGRMPWKGRDRRRWIQYLETMERIDASNQSAQPFESFSLEQQSWDLLSAEEHMRQGGLNDEMIAHFNRYIPSCFGAEADEISAAAFANYLSGELVGNYTFPGGLGALTAKLYRNHRSKVRLGSRVTRVEQDLHGARVTYQDSKGLAHTIATRVVIMAVPQRYVPWLVPGLPRAKREVIEGIRYSSYMVANVLCDRVLWDDKGYDTWIQEGYFKDIIDATWISRGGKSYADKNRPHVLTLYMPSGQSGVWSELSRDPAEIKEDILVDLERVIPGSRAHVHDITLSRFGHSMHVARPGFMTKVVPLLRRPFYRIYFAGAEVEGLPCNESAILSGWRAASEARAWLWDGEARLEDAAEAAPPPPLMVPRRR